MGQAVERLVIIDTVTCCKCGIEFGMPRHFLRGLREDSKKWFYCPSGHIQHFTSETELDKTRRELDRTKKRLDWAEQNARHEREQKQKTQRHLQRTESAFKRMKTRIGAGVCPCCDRTFQNIQNHMQTKHPDYKDRPVEKESVLLDREELEQMSYKDLVWYARECEILIFHNRRGRVPKTVVIDTILKAKDLREAE